MSIKPVSVTASWACGFCHKESTTYSADTKPERWEVVRLHGETDGDPGACSPKRESREILLCSSCATAYWKHVGEMVRFATDFWWGRVRMVANGEKPRDVELPWAREDRRKRHDDD